MSAVARSIEPDTLPLLRRTVTQEVIDAYAEASGDFNPIHVDPDFARTGPFGRTIAHGLMTLALAGAMLNRWSEGGFDRGGEIDVAFIGPVFAGDTLELGGTVEEWVERGGLRLARVRLSAQVGERAILGGHALVPVQRGEG